MQAEQLAISRNRPPWKLQQRPKDGYELINDGDYDVYGVHVGPGEDGGPFRLRATPVGVLNPGASLQFSAIIAANGKRQIVAKWHREADLSDEESEWSSPLP